MICSRCKRNFEDGKYKTCQECRRNAKEKRDEIQRTYKQGQFSSKDGISKQCCKCLETKSLENFYKNKRYKDGYINNCKDCHSVLWKTYYKEKYASVMSERFKTDIIYKLKQNIKSYLHIQLKNQNKFKESSSTIYLGCSIDFFKDWLFYNNVNYNSKEYHMDHVVPISLFDLNNQEEIDIAFNWTNIQVLPKKENIEKSNKFNMIEYLNHLINVHRFISLKTKNYTFLKQNLNYIKNKKFATLSNCGKSLRA
jgi:hypothetical protein